MEIKTERMTKLTLCDQRRLNETKKKQCFLKKL